MPRAMRETPIAMPIGIAVTQAAINAVKTRNIDQPKCSASGASVSLPRADSYKRANTVSGVGRNSGGSQRKWLASHHNATMANIVSTLIAVLAPSPRVVNLEVLGVPMGSDTTSLLRTVLWGSDTTFVLRRA